MNHETTVWVVDDDRSIRWVAEKALSRADIATQTFEDAETLLRKLQQRQQSPDVIISDIHMPGINGLELIEQIHAITPDLPIIITTAHTDLESAVSAYHGGAFEYLPKPFDIDALVAVTQRAISFRHESTPPAREGVADDSAPAEIIGEAPAMQEVFRAIGRLSHSHINVLITGKSGTGKELVARALHRHSPRRGEPFIALNMAAIPRDLIESELFGHEKGAFTGAAQQRKGRFEQAHNGTLFLDEIGDMPAEAQTRLLRVLADGEFYRVGGHTPVNVNVRIIAATHQNLEAEVAKHHFREDLFHRLNVIRIYLPELSERREDIPKLAEHFLQTAAIELNVETKVLLPDTTHYLTSLPWPGNVRELENCCRWLTAMAAGREIHIEDLPPALKEPQDQTAAPKQEPHWEATLEQWFARELAAGKKDVLGQATPRFEKIALKTALEFTGGRKREAAELLGWGRNTLTRKLKELEPDQEQ